LETGSGNDLMTDFIVSARIASEELYIDGDTSGVRLFIRRKRLSHIEQFGESKTIMMVHGASFSGGSLFDVPLGGASFMDFLAAKGFDVYSVDVRGYGESSRPVEMGQKPSANAPLVSTETGVNDFSSAIDAVLKARAIQRLNVFGMSWGGSIAGAYTSRNASKVRRIGLVAPQWLNDRQSRLDAGGDIPAYRLVNLDAFRTRWLAAVPEAKRSSFFPEGWFEQWMGATLALEPSEAARTANSIRATNGAVLDARQFWSSGKPIYSASEIVVPLLLVHGEWDADVRINQALAFFQAVTAAPYKRWVEIGEATHMVLMERNRSQAFAALAQFFEEALPWDGQAVR
jgi:pimeloyl-ACP methyl ester carboxylesterase